MKELRQGDFLSTRKYVNSLLQLCNIVLWYNLDIGEAIDFTRTLFERKHSTGMFVAGGKNRHLSFGQSALPVSICMFPLRISLHFCTKPLVKPAP